MSIASLIRQMAEAGASPEAIAIAVEAVEAAHAQDAERRAKAAEKKARQRATKRDNEGTVPGQGGDMSRDLPSSSEVSPQTPLPNSSNPLPPSPPKGGSSPKSRGERLPADFDPDYADSAALGLSPMEHSQEAAKFRDYWVAQPGQRGVKVDWPATWRNWVRKAVQDRRGVPRQASAPPQRTFNDVLNDIKNGVPPDASHPGPTIDASFERGDSASTGRLVQLHALPSRR